MHDSPPGGPALLADDVSKRYRRSRSWALQGVSLSIPEGSITALVGPNGAGKSTLIRCFMGFERPTRGSVRVAGIDPWTHRADALGRVGYVGQGATLYGSVSLRDHVAMATALRRRFDGHGAEARLGELQIPLDARAGELSGGQRAQVGLALAIATRAPILLLDEPIASLDPLARQDFFGVLEDVIREGDTTVLVSSHIVEELAPVCDSLIVLAPARVMLHSGISEAQATHRLVEGRAEGPDAVSSFTRPDRSVVSLIRVDAGGDASLDELVLGYLAAARSDSRAA